MTKALLALESGKVFAGRSFGVEGEAPGEVVFNTGMSGYQEILTDPSYCGQIITMTYPHIGNYGANNADCESDKSYVKGFVVRELSRIRSNWRSEESLEEFLRKQNILAVEGIDTRALTLHIREAGAMRAVLSTIEDDPKTLIAKAKAFPSMAGQDLVSVIKREKEDTFPSQKPGQEQLNVILIDYGCKMNIIRSLTGRGCRVTVVPPDMPVDAILARKSDGIMLSNGPGDPAAVKYAVDIVRKLTQAYSKPIFGICLGHQITGLALGGNTYKLKFGHRGINQPVKNLSTGQVEITSQNHGFNIDMNSLKNKDVSVTHINLNDNTVEGIRHVKKPIFSVQYHPEASPGPHDSAYLFDEFVSMIEKYKKQ